MLSVLRQYRGVTDNRQSNSSRVGACARYTVATLLLGALAAAVLSGCGGPPVAVPETAMAPRPVLYGTSLPFPRRFVSFDLFTRPTDSGTNLRLAEALLHVDAEGRVTDVAYESPEDSTRLAPHRYAFDALAFEPGRRQSQKVAMVLPVSVMVGDTAGPPVVTFPVDQWRRVTDGALYFEALARNGVEGPFLESFPSYYYKVTKEERRNIIYPYKLFRFDVDSTGHVSAIEMVGGTHDTFDDQLASAIRWATIKPAAVDGVVRPAPAFLVVAFFPQVHYPTAVWSPNAPDTLPLVERMRLRLVADTVGLMLGAVPQKDWSGEIVENDRHEYFEGTISAAIRVDTLGIGAVSKQSTREWKPIGILGMRAFRNHFFPARTWSGQVAPCFGLVFMDYLDESNIRIRFSWF